MNAESKIKRSTVFNTNPWKSCKRFSLAVFLIFPLICHTYAETGTGAESPLELKETSLRELAADRPDATESPVTVDKGHFQVESTFVSFARNDFEGTRTETWGIGESNIKYGFRDDMDFQVVIAPYIHEKEKTLGSEETNEDFGDIILRLKYNLWGNDDGATAFGLLPYVKIPTQTRVSNDHWEGGLITPFSWRVGEKWGIGLQAELGRVYDDDDRDLDWDFSHTAVLGFEITDRTGMYLEYLGSAGDHPYHSFFSGGLSYGLTDMILLDVGTVIGLNEEAEDMSVFTGITWKF